MKKTESAGGIVLNSRGEVALVTNGPTAWWGFPKGHVDPGESIEEAARREIWEETGLRELTLVKPLGFYERFRGGKDGGDDTSEFKRIHMFLFRTMMQELAPIDPGNPLARWVPMEAVAAMLTHRADKDFFLLVQPDLVENREHDLGNDADEKEDERDHE